MMKDKKEIENTIKYTPLLNFEIERNKNINDDAPIEQDMGKNVKNEDRILSMIPSRRLPAYGLKWCCE
jgi:hypothetical protein